MFDSLLNNLEKNVKKIINNPQLFYTIFVAVVIVGAFIFTAQRFVGIANDAQERLINIRVGSIQDSFTSFAGDLMNQPEYLNKKISEIILVNETIEDFDVISKINNDYIVIASDNLDQIGKSDPKADFLYSLAASDPNHSITVPLDGADGRLFQTARAIKDSQGNVSGIVMTTQTLSQADKVINNNITNSLGVLIVIVFFITLLFLRHSKIVDYMSLYKKLKEVDQLKDDFISMASHELRTPLSIIRGYAEFIREAKELDPQTKDYAEKIDISAKDLDALVADILDVSRIQQGRMSFNLEKINPAEMLESIVEAYEIPSTEKGLKISFDKSLVNSTQIIMADKDRLKQVFVNFIGNAIKYTIKGEVVIKQYTEANRLFIRVIDTGVGMSSEEKERLFEKFYRIRTKETEGIRGTGLGLWITAQIVNELKGKISVESIKGVGSHFIVSFPISS